MKNCRECQHTVSEQAFACPNCGAPYPAQEKWDGWGFEYQSPATCFGVPLLHISFKYRANRMPVPAKGVIAIGQFGMGIINISQFGVGVVSLSQFTLAGFAIAQFALAYSLIAQFGLYVDKGRGQFVWSLGQLLGGF
ncbi:MAG: zinc ribbon domain-containing protein [Candidatus Binatia bacterium]